MPPPAIPWPCRRKSAINRTGGSSTDKARFVGDVIAAVVATDELTAIEALKLISVEYEVLPAVFTPETAVADGAPLIHQESPRNIISDAGFQFGDQAKAWQEAELVFENEYETSIVQHCQMENHISYAYLDSDQRIVIVSSTQIPHIVRRIVGQALGIPWGRIRVIKPYIGGGFGSKQDICLEALNAAMTLAVAGRPVKIDYSRDECMIDTRTRHAFKSKMKTGVSKEGRLVAQSISLFSNNGAYASHGHSIAMAAGSKCHYVYNLEAFDFAPVTVYTNLPVAGAMRGYGSPQLAFFIESQMDDMAKEMGWDPLDFRLQNLMPLGYVDPHTGTEVLSCGIGECLERGRLLIDWDHTSGSSTKSKTARNAGAWGWPASAMAPALTRPTWNWRRPGSCSMKTALSSCRSGRRKSARAAIRFLAKWPQKFSACPWRWSM